MEGLQKKSSICEELDEITVKSKANIDDLIKVTESNFVKIQSPQQKFKSAFQLASLKLKQQIIYKPNSAIKSITEAKQVLFGKNE